MASVVTAVMELMRSLNSNQRGWIHRVCNFTQNNDSDTYNSNMGLERSDLSTD